MTPEGRDSFAVNVILLSKTAGPLLVKATINLDPYAIKEKLVYVTHNMDSTVLGLFIIFIHYVLSSSCQDIRESVF